MQTVWTVPQQKVQLPLYLWRWLPLVGWKQHSNHKKELIGEQYHLTVRTQSAVTAPPQLVSHNAGFIKEPCRKLLQYIETLFLLDKLV